MKHIIVISGKQYSGKDTLAGILINKLPDYKRIGLGDAIKIEFAKKNNITIDEILKNKHLYRNGLIELGNWGRDQDEDYWIKNLVACDKIIVPDVRVQHEADFFKNVGAFLVRVESDYENRSKRGVIVNNDDPTEIALDNYSGFDLVVYNNSSYEDLVLSADKVISAYNNFLSVH